MFINDYNAMCAEVYLHQHIETGGNLFGLWTTSGSAIIHVMLGPGQNCKRTSTSFHQDLEYMARVGRFVNDNYMLCHIGEWHSHHNLSLSKPSAGDESTIRRNFPQGMSKFLVIIANIQNGDTIKLSPYFFTDGGARYEMAECVFLQSGNPFSTHPEILTEIEQGAEGKHQRNESYHSAVVIQSSQNTSTYSQVVSSPRNTGSSSQQYGNTISTNRQVSPTNGLTKSPVSQTNPPAVHTAAQATNKPSENEAFQDQTANSENEQATEKEVVMKNTYDELEKYFGKGKVEIEQSINHDDINMIFEHKSYYWMLRFPKTFPNRPAKFFRELMRRDLSNSSPYSEYLLETPLTNPVNILLSIKKMCWSTCHICKSITKEKLTKPVATVIPDNAKVGDVVKGLTTEIQVTLTPTSLSFAGKAQSDGSYRIEFEHYVSKWSIEIPSEFPGKPAEVYKQGRYGPPQKQSINELSSSRLKEKPLISSDLIMSAIRSNCVCSQCYKLH